MGLEYFAEGYIRLHVLDSNANFFTDVGSGNYEDIPTFDLRYSVALVPNTLNSDYSLVAFLHRRGLTGTWFVTPSDPGTRAASDGAISSPGCGFGISSREHPDPDCLLDIERPGIDLINRNFDHVPTINPFDRG